MEETVWGAMVGSVEPWSQAEREGGALPNKNCVTAFLLLQKTGGGGRERRRGTGERGIRRVSCRGGEATVDHCTNCGSCGGLEDPCVSALQHLL